MQFPSLSYLELTASSHNIRIPGRTMYPFPKAFYILIYYYKKFEIFPILLLNEQDVFQYLTVFFTLLHLIEFKTIFLSITMYLEKGFEELISFQ